MNTDQFLSIMGGGINRDRRCYDDIYYKKYQFLEYIPLINARAHTLGQKREILNNSFKIQYQKTLNKISCASTSILNVKYSDLLILSYYLLLQDRINESLNVYQIILNNKNILKECQQNVSMFFDYYQAYMSLYSNANINDSIKIIKDIVDKYKNISLIKSKQSLFNNLQLLLNDLNNNNTDPTNEQKETNSSKIKDNKSDERSLDFVVDEQERKLIITYKGVSNISVNFYTMNTEILFSETPFININKNDKNQLSFNYIKPTKSIPVKLNKTNKFMDYTLYIPTDFKNKNTFIQICDTESSLECSKAFFDNELMIQVKQQYGQIKVYKKVGNSVVPAKKAYCKVYAKTGNYDKNNEFYKDGYTDVSGKFDYVSISTDQLDRTSKFSIFVTLNKYGSLIKSNVNIPKR